MTSHSFTPPPSQLSPRLPARVNFYDDAELIRLVPYIAGKGKLSPPPNFRYNIDGVQNFRYLTESQQQVKITAFVRLSTREKNACYRKIVGINYCDDADLKKKFPLRNGFGTNIPPPTFRTSSRKVSEWRKKTSEEQQTFINEYKALSKSQKTRLWNTVPGIRKNKYYPSKNRQNNQQATRTIQATGTNDTQGVSTTTINHSVNNSSNEGNSTRPHGFAKVGFDPSRIQYPSHKRKYGKRKHRPKNVHQQQDRTSINAENRALTEVAALIEACCMHNPTSNPLIREMPDGNVGVLFCVFSHVNKSPLRGYNRNDTISLARPRALIMSNRREGVKHMVGTILRDFINSSKSDYESTYEWEEFFSDVSSDPNYLTKEVSRRKDNRKKHRSLPRRGPASVEDVDRAMPSEEIGFTPVSFL